MITVLDCFTIHLFYSDDKTINYLYMKPDKYLLMKCFYVHPLPILFQYMVQADVTKLKIVRILYFLL